MEERCDWIDNADSYICPKCRFECNNPLYYSKVATCPRCGFTPTKYIKMSEFDNDRQE